jgi:hypothetical protein
MELWASNCGSILRVGRLAAGGCCAGADMEEGPMRTFQDHNFLVWEVYPSGGRHGFSDNPHLIFHCLTQRDIRSRFMESGGDEASAERIITDSSPDELLAMLERAREIP